MGTYVEVMAEPAAGIAAAEVLGAVEAAYAAIERVEACMSPHRPDSDLCRIAAAPAGAVLVIDPWTWDVLALAGQLHQASAGLFDCAADAGRPGASQRVLQLLPAARVQVGAPVRVDLGGIAKGHAVDRAVAALRAAGIRQGRVNAGGDLRVLGPVPQPIHVRDPSVPGRLRHLGDLADGAVATSAPGAGARLQAQPLRSAIVDPRSGQALAGGASYTVVAPTCALADGLTKVLALGGAQAHGCLAAFGAQGWVL